MPGSIRLFVTSALAEGVEIAATPAQAHYVGHVMRRTAGSMVLLFNGVDGEWEACVATVRGEHATFVVESRLRRQAPAPDVWLAFAPLRRDPTGILVQKATELGVDAMLPVLTTRANTGRIKPPRLQAIAIEAAEQSERLTLPRIHDMVDLKTLLRHWPTERRLVVAMERTKAPRPCYEPGPVALLVGPEGGFTERELDASLGPLILRAETAAIVGLALLQAPCPDPPDGQTA
jgi:16S rRNA (uracil1498-N3)-methyltransferase